MGLVDRLKSIVIVGSDLVLIDQISLQVIELNVELLHVPPVMQKDEGMKRKAKQRNHGGCCGFP